MPGHLERIWIKRAKGGPMDSAERARLRADRGLVGNANQGGRRQVTIIDAARWADHQAALGKQLDPAGRRANLMLHGIDLANSRGKVLRIGAVRLHIAGETKPCHQMDESCPSMCSMCYERMLQRCAERLEVSADLPFETTCRLLGVQHVLIRLRSKRGAH